MSSQTSLSIRISSRSLAAKLNTLERFCRRFGWAMDGFIDEPSRRINIGFRGVGRNAGRMISVVGTFDRCHVHHERIVTVTGPQVGSGSWRPDRIKMEHVWCSSPCHVREALKSLGHSLLASSATEKVTSDKKQALSEAGS